MIDDLRRLPKPQIGSTPGDYVIDSTLQIMIPQPRLSEQQALVTSLAKPRFRRFRAVARGSDREAVRLYLVDAEIASELHAAARIAEVALREHIHRALAATYGDRWFQTHSGLFDERTLDSFNEVIEKLGARAAPGKVIAQIMFGTWVSLLGKGDKKPDGTRANYKRDLWAASLSSQFDVDRSTLHALAMRVNWARNRISHCEPVVFGLPMPGLGGPNTQIRRSPAVIFEDIQDLAGLVNPSLSDWLGNWSDTYALFLSPLAQTALDDVARDPKITLIRTTDLKTPPPREAII
ncbi:MAG TPA: hypothetical protein VNJ54_04140 [Plantibacter sp.]|uniref:hypothetical protein n=1 Tax=unclassified Plantibacter TaxID=2624265 RepID=UPI002C3D0B68|nr:hypothetical protein [Plantibacter sp.]